MTVTLTYDSTLSRVRITATGLTAAADYATVERSTDQIMWTTVRGGVEVALSAGSFVDYVDDYEFVDGVANYYRVRGIDTSPITFVAAGSNSTGSSGSRTPGAPAGITDRDVVYILASTRNSGTGTVNTPADWEVCASDGNLTMFGRIYDGVWVMPTITYTGGAANEDTIAQSAAFRNAALIPAAYQVQLNASAQNVAYPSLTVPGAGHHVIAAAWKADDMSGVSTLAGWTEIGEASSSAGNDASQAWDCQIQTTATNIGAGSFTFGGGAAAISRALMVAFAHADYLNEQTASITPALDRIWLKSLNRPFLNRAISVTDWSDVDRPDRGGSHEVINRTLPVAVTDVGGSRRFDLLIYSPTREDRQTFEYILASGDLLFLHTPAGCEVPSGYFRVAGSSERRPHRRATSRVFTLPVVESAPPGPDVVGATITWADVLGMYATWADLLAANPTWADLMARIAPPTEVIVP